jgi:hypothetical protein
MGRFSRRVVTLSIVFLGAAAVARGQSGAIQGRVTDTEGHPIKGATITASNPNGKPSEHTATTDDKGRFGIIGMTGGAWTFIAEAPGFIGQRARANIRSTSTGNGQLAFDLPRAPGPLPGALGRQIATDIATANELRQTGRVDQALAAYEDIISKNPTLTMVHLVIGDMYCMKAEREGSPAMRQPLYDRAIASYQQVLKTDPDNASAKTALERTEAAKRGLTN